MGLGPCPCARSAPTQGRKSPALLGRNPRGCACGVLREPPAIWPPIQRAEGKDQLQVLASLGFRPPLHPCLVLFLCPVHERERPDLGTPLQQAALQGENDVATRGRPWARREAGAGPRRRGRARALSVKGTGAGMGVWSSLLTLGPASDPYRYRSSWAGFLRDLYELPAAPCPPSRSPLPHKNALPSATVTVAVTGTLNPTPGLPAAPLSLPHPHLSSSSPGPQMRMKAEFHARQRPASSGEGKTRAGAAPKLMSQVRLNPEASLRRALMAREARPQLSQPRS